MSSNSTKETFLSTSEGHITPANTIAIGAVLSGLAGVFVALRLWCRMGKTKTGVRVDDWLIIVAFILTLGMGLMLIIGSALHGLAQPTPEGTGPKGYFTATDDAEIITEKIFWAFNLTQCWAFGLAKLSVLFFYRQIFGGKPVFNMLNTAMIVIVLCWSISFFFAILFRCGTNFWALWAPLIYLLQNCYASTPMFMAFSISDVITDFFILAMPIYWVTRLTMSPKKKIAVCGVFLLGSLVIGAGLARLVIFVQQTNNPYQNADGIGHLTTEIWWSMLEMGISIIAACLPTIWPLVTGLSIEGMVATVRSMFSLESLSSRGSRRGAGPGSTAKHEGGDDSAALASTGPYTRVSESAGSASASASRSREKNVGVETMPMPPMPMPAPGIPLGDLEAQNMRPSAK